MVKNLIHYKCFHFNYIFYFNTSLKRKHTFDKKLSELNLEKLYYLNWIYYSMYYLTRYRSDNQNYSDMKGNPPPSGHQISYQQYFPCLKNRQIVHCMYSCEVHWEENCISIIFYIKYVFTWQNHWYLFVAQLKRIKCILPNISKTVWEMIITEKLNLKIWIVVACPSPGNALCLILEKRFIFKCLK